MTRFHLPIRRILAATCLVLAGTNGAIAGTESMGTNVAIALPVIAGGITLVKDDWKGTAQVTVDTSDLTREQAAEAVISEAKRAFGWTHAH